MHGDNVIASIDSGVMLFFFFFKKKKGDILVMDSKPERF
jgi:hypothetical protein